MSNSIVAYETGFSTVTYILIVKLIKNNRDECCG